jgi:nitrite reductase (NADH) large subunit
VSNKVIIIGGGVAAVNAIKAIRELDSEAEINVFQNEKFYPYYRIKLTKNLFDIHTEDKILLQKKEWYDLNNVSLHLGEEVVDIDIYKQEITLSSGSRFSYDKLLLANGSSNFMPPIDGIEKENVHTIRKLSNIHDIKNNIEHKKAILIIGGGIQGLETAWVLHQHGKEVIISEVLERLMPRQMDKRASEILRKTIESFNIKLLLNTQIKEVSGKDKVEGVTTNNEDSIACDMIIYSVGIRPNKKLLENTPVKTNLGVIVNDKMQTNIENVYAVGDVAELCGKIGGLWGVALEQGKIAGYNIAGREAAYTASVPVTMMNAFNISLFSAGNIDENSCDETLMDTDSDRLTYKRLFIKDNKIIGAILIGDTKPSTLLKSMIEKETVLSHIDIAGMSVDELLIKLKSN